MRDIVLAKCKVALRERNKDIDVAEKVYVNEHLSPENKRLFAMASKVKKDFDYKYLWTKKGTIF